jgi:hypothetical protein
MIHLKLFENFKDIYSICKKYNITNYTINSDGSIDVDGDVNLENMKLSKLPLKFRNVSGCFYCNRNQLTSLEGAPQSVGDFYCGDNQLTSLEGAPQSVGDDFDCSYNKLTSLEGAPQSVGGGFSCGDNQLTSLEGAPQSVGDGFYCGYNQLTSLEGAPQSVGGDFDCGYNPVYKVWSLFMDYSKIELLNDYDPFREVDGEPAIILDRLNDFLAEIGKDPAEKVDDYINI